MASDPLYKATSYSDWIGTRYKKIMKNDKLCIKLHQVDSVESSRVESMAVCTEATF